MEYIHYNELFQGGGMAEVSQNGVTLECIAKGLRRDCTPSSSMLSDLATHDDTVSATSPSSCSCTVTGVCDSAITNLGDLHSPEWGTEVMQSEWALALTTKLHYALQRPMSRANIQSTLLL